MWNTPYDHLCVAKCPKMSCPNNIAPGSFLMDSLMGGSSSFRAEGYSRDPGMYLHTAAEYGYSVMTNMGRIGPHSLSKREEAPAAAAPAPAAAPLQGFQDGPYLSAQLATWTPGSKGSSSSSSRRDQQPVAQCLQPGSFPAGNVKEEAFCCLYQDDSNKGKQTTESSSYIRLGDNSCRPQQTAAPAGGCFQVYSEGRPQQDDQQFPSGFSLTHLATSVESVAAEASTVGCSDTPRERPRTHECLRDRKEEKAKSDSCSEHSDGELKGTTLPPPPSTLHPPSPLLPNTHAHTHTHTSMQTNTNNNAD